MEKGKFIVFEGIDGSGKSTQIKRLYNYLTSKGVPCYVTCEPTGSPFGTMIRQCLTGQIETDDKTIAGLFVADRLDHLYNNQNGLIKKINEGITVLCDRYYFSSYAYHGAFMDINWVIDANRLAAQALKPDVNIFIDVLPEVTFERLKSRGATDRYEKLESMKKIRQKYFEAFELLKDSENIQIVKGAEDKSVTEERIIEVAKKLFNF